MRTLFPILVAAVLTYVALEYRENYHEFLGSISPFRQSDTSIELSTPKGYKPAAEISHTTWEDKAAAALSLVEETPAVAAPVQPAPAIAAAPVAPVRTARFARTRPNVRRALSAKRVKLQRSKRRR